MWLRAALRDVEVLGEEGAERGVLPRPCRTHCGHDRWGIGEGPAGDGYGVDGNRQAERRVEQGGSQGRAGCGPDRVYLRQRQVRTVRRREASDLGPAEGEIGVVVWTPFVVGARLRNGEAVEQIIPASARWQWTWRRLHTPNDSLQARHR